jgi:hypothetical protein
MLNLSASWHVSVVVTPLSNNLQRWWNLWHWPSPSDVVTTPWSSGLIIGWDLRRHSRTSVVDAVPLPSGKNIKNKDDPASWYLRRLICTMMLRKSFRGLSPVFPTHSLWPYFLASFCRISLWEKLVGKKLLLPVKSQKLLLFSLHYYTLCSCWEKQVFVRREKVGVRNLESLRRWAPPPICRTPRIWKLVRAKAF